MALQFINGSVYKYSFTSLPGATYSFCVIEIAGLRQQLLHLRSLPTPELVRRLHNNNLGTRGWESSQTSSASL